MGQPAQQTEQALIEITDLAAATVADVLACYPQTIPVFLHHGLACVGCSLSRFELMADVPAIYGLDLGSFLQEVRRATAGLDNCAHNSTAGNGGEAK